LPFYTQWSEPRWELIAYYVAHCTAGDVLIGMTTFIIALSLSRAGGRASWPGSRIVAWTILAAVAYTVWSERINLAQGNWSYSVWMPVLP
jgi:hypothetical protein